MVFIERVFIGREYVCAYAQKCDVNVFLIHLKCMLDAVFGFPDVLVWGDFLC